MYLYFLPLPLESEKRLLEEIPEHEELQVPTSDGGIEVTEARFLPATEWLRLAQTGEIILFPPQFLLLHLVAEFLDKAPRPVDSPAELERRRVALTEFVYLYYTDWERSVVEAQKRNDFDG